MSKRGLITAAIASVAVPGGAVAQETLPEVPVEALPILSPSVEKGKPEAFSPAPVADGGELLRAVPGVWGSRFGGAGIDPTIRGQDETQLNVLLDGSYIHGGCPNRMDPPTSYVAPETYDDVEVIKGNQTVIYGGGGSGGTVRFERNTERFGPEEHLRGKVGGGYRSNGDAKEVFGDVAVGNETGYTRLIGNFSDANSYEDGDGDTVRSAYTHTSGTALLGYTPDDDTRLELGLETFRGTDVLYTGMMDSPESTNDSVRLRFDRDAGTGFLDGLKAEAYYNDVHHLMDNYSLRERSKMFMRTPTDSVTYGGRIQGEIFAGARTAWTVGLDHQFNNREALRYSGNSRDNANTIQAIMWPDADLAQTGVFSEVETDLTDQDHLKVGLRYDRVTADVGRADEAAADGRTPNDLYSEHYGTSADEVTEDNVGGLVHYARDLSRKLTLHGTVSRSLRTADATERFMAGNQTKKMGDWVGNPDIDPEKHHQAEAGLTWSARNSRVAVTAYYNDVDDYILTDLGALDGNDNRATIYRNVDATLIGGELSARRKWAGHWVTRGTAAYVHAENDTDGTALPQTPPLEGTVGVDYEAAVWDAGAEVRMVAEQDRVDLASGQDVQETPGYAVVNVEGGVNLGKQARLSLGVDNLLDKTYSEHINRQDPSTGQGLLVNEPGRSLWARVKATF